MTLHLDANYPTTSHSQTSVKASWADEKGLNDGLQEWVGSQAYGVPLTLGIVDWIQEHAHEYAKPSEALRSGFLTFPISSFRS